jgi:hypothetical protein
MSILRRKQVPADIAQGGTQRAIAPTRDGQAEGWQFNFERAEQGLVRLAGTPLVGQGTPRVAGAFRVIDTPVNAARELLNRYPVAEYTAQENKVDAFISPGGQSTGMGRGRARNMRMYLHGYDEAVIPANVNPQNIIVLPALGYKRPPAGDLDEFTGLNAALTDAARGAAIFAYWATAAAPTVWVNVTGLVSTVEGPQSVGAVTVTIPAATGGGRLYLFTTPFDGVLEAVFDSPEGSANVSNQVMDKSFREINSLEVINSLIPFGFDRSLFLFSGQRLVLRFTGRGSIRWSAASIIEWPNWYQGFEVPETVRQVIREQNRRSLIGF